MIQSHHLLFAELILTQWWQKCWPGRLVEGNSANVEFLDLIYRPDGQSAVVGQSQTVQIKTVEPTLDNWIWALINLVRHEEII